MHDFATKLIAWQKKNGRHHLPWQQTRDAYHIWLSEIMLQQTQVNTVLDYYQNFLEKFPTVHALAIGSLDEVMSLWAGLGYYSRARNLHRCAREIITRFSGTFPSDPKQLASLPGIGQSTAAAICVFAYGTQAAILDGNVKRVLTRIFGISGYPGTLKIERQLWHLAESLLPTHEIEIYTQGLMDLGATLCKRVKPVCLNQPKVCPFTQKCIAYQQNKTASLPTPKPFKKIPLRHAIVLILRHQNHILLQRRPLTGIWGGLWCFPQIDIPKILNWPSSVQQEWLDMAQTLGTIIEYHALPEKIHTFTHFRLRLLPLLIELDINKSLYNQVKSTAYMLTHVQSNHQQSQVKAHVANYEYSLKSQNRDFYTALTNTKTTHVDINKNDVQQYCMSSAQACPQTVDRKEDYVYLNDCVEIPNQWFSPQEQNSIGIPTPIKQLIDNVMRASKSCQH